MLKQKVKVIVAGDAGVGKTSLVQLYCSNGTVFHREYHMTQAVEIMAKTIEININKDVELYFFDVSGREIYRQVVQKMIKGAEAVILVYDCTNETSYRGVETWYDMIKKANGNKDIKGILVSMKNDLSQVKTVTTKQGKDLAKKLEMPLFELTGFEY